MNIRRYSQHRPNRLLEAKIRKPKMRRPDLTNNSLTDRPSNLATERRRQHVDVSRPFLLARSLQDLELGELVGLFFEELSSAKDYAATFVDGGVFVCLESAGGCFDGFVGDVDGGGLAEVDGFFGLGGYDGEAGGRW